MDTDQILNSTKEKFQRAFEHFEGELKKLRTGRAHPSMLDGITAEAYGTSMPLNQLATITAPESQLLQISPFDPNNLEAIANAIRENQALGFNPTDDGHIIRIPIPPLTEERRKEIAKQLGTKSEEAMISMRNTRHEALKEAETAKKDKQLSEDDYSRLQKQVDDLVQEFKQKIENTAKDKEAEILTI